MTPAANMDLLERVGETFVTTEFPTEEQLGASGLLIDKKHKNKLGVLRQEKERAESTSNSKEVSPEG
jgi:hypothetical protein